MAAPRLAPHRRANLLEIAPMARGEIVEADDVLSETQQRLDQM